MNVLGQADIQGTQYAIIDSGEGGYINGIYARYILAPIATVEKTIPPDQQADVVKDQ